MALIAVPLIAAGACKKGDETVAVINYIFLNPKSPLVLVQGSDTTVHISGGTPPFSVVKHAKAPFAFDSLKGSTLFLTAGVPGSTKVVIGDAASPQQQAEMQLTITAQ